MAYEIAIILSYLGTAFLLLFIAFSLNEDQKYIKFFFMATALLFLLINSNSTLNLIEYQNATLTNSSLVTLTNRARDSIYTITISFGFLVFYALIIAFIEITRMFRRIPKW